MSDNQFVIEWIDYHREPKVSPNPLYPKGIDLDVTAGNTPACVVDLPYPAKRIGSYVIKCQSCLMEVSCTTAGRIDDPRSIKIPCKSIQSTEISDGQHRIDRIKKQF